MLTSVPSEIHSRNCRRVLRSCICASYYRVFHCLHQPLQANAGTIPQESFQIFPIAGSFNTSYDFPYSQPQTASLNKPRGRQKDESTAPVLQYSILRITTSFSIIDFTKTPGFFGDKRDLYLAMFPTLSLLYGGINEYTCIDRL
jgi:hypothetical protein